MILFQTNILHNYHCETIADGQTSIETNNLQVN